jgi:hypothetical protein
VSGRRPDAVRALRELARRFGPEAARAKQALLAELAGRRRVPATRLAELQEALLLVIAYPDDERVLAAAHALVPRLRAWAEALPRRERARLADTGVAGSAVVDTYGFPLLERLARLFPGALELDWDTLDDTGPLQLAVARTLLGAEVPGIDDVTRDWDDWFAAARGPGTATDLELLLALFARAPLAPAEREWRFDGCGLPVRWSLAQAGSARAELVWPVARTAWQRRAPAPWRGSIAALVRKPLAQRRLDARAGERFLDLAAPALAARQSEIRPLSSGNPEDVTLADCGGGLEVALVGVRPHFREALESLTTALVLRNGVPIAYGPASVSAGSCELGLNLFEEFRGLETRRLYAQYMRALHHGLGAHTFFLTPYGMGAGNPEALRAGSFWFYRRLGFRPTNPAVETLARAEERRLAGTSGARSSLAMLRRLADTSVTFPLARRAEAPLPLGAIGLAVTRRITAEHRGDRERAQRNDVARVTRALALGRSVPRATLELVAPVLALDSELERRPRAERARLARFVRAKAAPSERGADAELGAAAGFLAALRGAAR